MSCLPGCFASPSSCLPSLTIHSSHSSNLILQVNGLFTPTSKGWHKPVHPPPPQPLGYAQLQHLNLGFFRRLISSCVCVAAIRVQEKNRNDTIWHSFHIQTKHCYVNTDQHHSLIHPCCLLTHINHIIFVSRKLTFHNATSHLIYPWLNTINGLRSLPEAVTVTT